MVLKVVAYQSLFANINQYWHLIEEVSKEFLLQTEITLGVGIVVKYSKDKQKNIIELVKAAQNIIDNHSSFSEDARKIYHLKFNAQTESEKIYKIY